MKEKDPDEIRQTVQRKDVMFSMKAGFPQKHTRKGQITEIRKRMSDQNFPDAEALRKLSEARWMQFQHEFELQSWPVWRRVIHRLMNCPICRPERVKRFDRGD